MCCIATTQYIRPDLSTTLADLREPVKPYVTARLRSCGNGFDERTCDALPAQERIDKQILQVANVLCPQVGGKKMRDAHQLSITGYTKPVTAVLRK